MPGQDQPSAATSRQKKRRILVKVTDIDTGHELASHEMEISAFGSCTTSSCSSCDPPPDIDEHPF